MKCREQMPNSAHNYGVVERTLFAQFNYSVVVGRFSGSSPNFDSGLFMFNLFEIGERFKKNMGYR